MILRPKKFIQRKVKALKNKLFNQSALPAVLLDDKKFAHKPLNFFRTSIGNYYLPTDAINDCIAVKMRKGEIFEPEIVEVARQYIKKDSTVLDLGANFGQMSLLFSQFTGEDGQVIAVEADDYLFEVLTKNIAANNCQNIRIFMRAVYDESDKAMIYPVQDFKRFPAYGSYGLDPNAVEGRQVTTMTIDELNIQTPISFMKVDVQGSDLFAMRGAIETIKRHQMPILFEYEEQFQKEFHTSFQDYLDFINSISYKVERTVNAINYLIVPDTRKATSAKPASHQSETNSSNGASVSSTLPMQKNHCKFLKSREEIDECTHLLHMHGFVSHYIKCKDWDLANIIPLIGDGNFLDMGSSDSYVLKNITFKGVQGKKYGIDLREPDFPVNGVEYVVGDLMDSKLPDNFFKNITCLSVIEHEVDFKKFVREVVRLLENSGKLFVTFDYWDPKVNPPIKMYDLNWQPLDKQLLEGFIFECEQNGLYLIDDMNWDTNEAVIRDGYYSPHPTISYTFGLCIFEKRQKNA